MTVAVAAPNEQAKTVAKALVDRWFYTHGIPSRIHSDQGKSFDERIWSIIPLIQIGFITSKHLSFQSRELLLLLTVGRQDLNDL